MSDTTKVFRVEPGERQGPVPERERLDRAIQRRLAHIPSISRTLVQAWIEAGRVRVNGTPVHRPGVRLSLGDEIELTRPEAPPLAAPTPTEMDLDVLYEDDWLLAVNKPPGLLVHPTPRVREGTLWNGLLYRAREWGEGHLPGLAHRLDRDTSGVLLVAKTRPFLAALLRALRSKGTEKEYLALVYGRVEGSKGRIDLGILRDEAHGKRWAASKTGGLPSSTLWERLGESERAPLTLLACRLLTGRTHQIRVHLDARGWPIVGDPLYGEPRQLAAQAAITDVEIAARCREFPRQALHARRLTFLHPMTRERMVVEAPMPKDLRNLLAVLGMSEWARLGSLATP